MRPIACEFDVSAVRLNRPASDCEPQSDPALFSRAASVDAIEAIENTIPVRGRNPRSRVSYLDRGPAARRTHFDCDRAAIWRVFYRIVYQIHECMPDERGVCRSTDSDRSSERKLLLLFVGEYAKLIDDMSHQPSEFQELWGQLDFSRVGARED